MKKIFKTEVTLIICLISIYLGFVWATIFPQAPYAVFVSGVTGVFGIVATRRYHDHKLNGSKNGTED